MTFGIIIKNSSKRFKPHFNREFSSKSKPHGMYVHTREEYLKEMKNRGLEPYAPDSVKKNERKEYKPSKWAHDVARSIEQNGVTGSALDAINKKMQYKPRKIKVDGKGGFEQ